MKPLVVIPARAGSKGLPGKNWKQLNGKPLIQYTIEAAKKVFKLEEICISTDSREVIEIAQSLHLNVPFVRPDYLSSDNVGSQEVLLHALAFWDVNYYSPDVIILLQPTSPFRNEFNIREGLSFYNSNIDMVVGVKETKVNPYFVLKEEDENGFLKASKPSLFARRQDCPKVYEVNGAFYAINPQSLSKSQIQSFDKVVKYVMDEISSLDIDDQFDWLMAETFIKNS